MRWFGICLVALFLLGCGREHSLPRVAYQTYIVKKDSTKETMHFTGNIQPIQENTLSSPVEGVLEHIHFHYGQHVFKDETIYTLNSPELQKQYNDVLTEYLKSKDNYSISKAKFSGTEELWHAGLISKNNYMIEKSGLNTARITLLQASKKLQEILEKMGETAPAISKLSFNEFDKVRLALANKHSVILLKAPCTGVLLYPPKTHEKDSPFLSVGSSIKAGQVLALVGDLSGVRVNIDIPEIDLNKVKIGMPANIHGVAFENEILKGRLIAINAQASSENGSALPSFTAVVEVPKLSKGQQALIKVGMSASVDLMVDNPLKLYVPIQAVHVSSEKSTVTIQDNHRERHEVVVTTGATRGQNVVIESGLHEGDVVVYEP